MHLSRKARSKGPFTLLAEFPAEPDSGFVALATASRVLAEKLGGRVDDVQEVLARSSSRSTAYHVAAFDPRRLALRLPGTRNHGHCNSGIPHLVNLVSLDASRRYSLADLAR